ncbi:MAG: hypothetical protein R3E12_20425 [Candidatus Eisenbacteria bacterium]
MSDESIAFHNAEIRAGRWAKWYLARVAPGRSGDADRVRPQVHPKVHRGEASRCEPGKAGAFGRHAAAPGREAGAPADPTRTGRYHQIRATLAHLGFPPGDDRYGGQIPGDPNPPYLEHAALRSDLRAAPDPVDAGAPSKTLIANRLNRISSPPSCARPKSAGRGESMNLDERATVRRFRS